jgi:hypothetical protein
MKARFLRALVLTTWFYGLLAWIYVAARILTNDDVVFEPFIYTIPWLSFWELGAAAFIISSVCMFVYLYIWGS